MRNWFTRLKLSRQLVLVSGLFLLIPMLVLWYTLLRGQQDASIQTRLREAQARCTQALTQVQRAAELCNMSTQVFLNTPALVDQLHMLTLDVTPEASQLLDFYRTNIASLEKITLSNPYLYQTRVYSVSDQVTEMVPILYSAQRMRRMPWAQGELASGSWHLDFDDQLFDTYPVTPHIMSLVTAITTSTQEQVGVLEVAVRMDEILPGLFDGTPSNWAVLVDSSGQLLAGDVLAEDAPLLELAQAEDGAQYRLDGARVMVTRVYLRELDCTYVQVTSLDDIYRTMLLQSLYLLAVVLAAFALMTLKVSLQPIVENAVVHGAAALCADSTITLTGTCDRAKGQFAVRITDQGQGMGAEVLERLRRQIAGEEPARSASASGNGIGLKNVQDRIQMAYGPGYGLYVESRPGGGTAVTATFPYQEPTEDRA